MPFRLYFSAVKTLADLGLSRDADALRLARAHQTESGQIAAIRARGGPARQIAGCGRIADSNYSVPCGVGEI